jgi:hypothetical protein
VCVFPFSDNHVRSLIQHCIERGVPCIPTIDVLRKVFEISCARFCRSFLLFFQDVLRIDEGSKGDEEDGIIKFFKLVSFGKAIHFIEKAYSIPFPFENAVDRDQKLQAWVTSMPNAVKSTVLLMKMSFALEKPSTKEAKSSLYKSLLEQKIISLDDKKKGAK